MKSLLLVLLASVAITVSEDADTYSTSNAKRLSCTGSDETEYCDCDDNNEEPIFCSGNTKYDNCVNGGCDRRNCSQVGQPQICIDPEKCRQGCVCADGYLRSTTGACVKIKDCDICNGDVNAHPGCGTHCNNRCSSYKEKNEVCCTTLCQDGCDCNKGFVYDDNLNKCVRPENCTPTCGKNEVFDSCINGRCFGARNCSEIGALVRCNKIKPEFCIPGCLCAEGYLRARNGTCVLKEHCDGPICGKNEEFSTCINGGCYTRNCSQIGQPVPCPAVLELIKCLSGCVCTNGYLRAQNGTCVLRERCDICGKDENAHPGCGINCNRRCATYKTKQEDCPDICKVDGCDCNDGFVYDDNIKKCVKPENCTPTCKSNEVFNSCIQGHCKATNCSQIGKSIPCPRIDPRFCKVGCLCKEGYLRDRNGTCVPMNKCNVCNGDVNAHPGCGYHCIRCSNYKSKFRACPRIACIKGKGCDCNDGYVFDDNLKKCVKPEDCTPTCQLSEVYNECANGVCQPLNCSQKGQMVPCPPMVYGSCRGACICKDGYLRAENGTCVLEEKCQLCQDGDIYSTCPPQKCDAEYCPQSRNDPLSCVSTKECGPPRCICGFNQHRDRTSGKCIPTSKCPPFPCGPNEKFDSCPPVCPGQNCSDYLTNATCPKYRIGIVVPCRPQCRCLDGYYRNHKGLCVPAKQCQKEACPPGEVFSTCPAVKCDADNCPLSQDARDSCPIGIVCDPPRCICSYGRKRDRITKQCIPAEDCPPFPCNGTHEEYKPCPNICPTDSCMDKLKKPICPQYFMKPPCKPDCRCCDNYYRDGNGKCVHLAECKKCPKENQYWDPCPPNCGSQNCTDIGKKFHCPLQSVDRVCVGACRCAKGFYKNDKGDCISERDCKRCIGQNEFWDICPQNSRPETCSSIGENYSCPRDPTGGTCDAACRCIEGYYRNNNNECVSEQECTEDTSPGDDDDDDDYDSDGDDDDDDDDGGDGVNALDKFVTANINFTLNFLNYLTQKNPGKSLITSAVSVSSVLLQMLPYTEGNTRDQLCKAFNLKNRNEIDQAIPPLLKSIQSSENITLTIAGKVYTKYPASKDFKNFSKVDFNAETEKVDFSKNVEAAGIINNWVKNQTNGKITDLVPADALDSLTRLVLVNAIYFKGTWAKQFESKNTKELPFYKLNGDKINVPTMYIKDKFDYYNDVTVDAQFVTLPYQNKDYFYLLAVPNQKDGLPKLASGLVNVFANVIKSLSRYTCQIKLPKYLTRTSIDLADPLKNVANITDLFDPNKAKLSGLLEKDEDLFVSKALQQAFIEVNEIGAEAAAATAIVVKALSLRVSKDLQPIVNANRPFIYFIMSKNYQQANAVIFSGVYAGD